MRTIVKGGWVVGWKDDTHVLFRDGVVVFEDGRILHVGPRFDGRVDRTLDARGKLISPGFIDTHVHSGHRASHRLITDTGRPDYFGQPFLEISVTRGPMPRTRTRRPSSTPRSPSPSSC
jgi:cytosine/adenosine deaminase-related metal-dependent hydrolase